MCREDILRLEAERYKPSLKMDIDVSLAVKASLEELFIFEDKKDSTAGFPMGVPAVFQLNAH